MIEIGTWESRNLIMERWRLARHTKIVIWRNRQIYRRLRSCVDVNMRDFVCGLLGISWTQVIAEHERLPYASLTYFCVTKEIDIWVASSLLLLYMVIT